MNEDKDVHSSEKEDENSLKSYFQLKEVLTYFKRLFGKKDPNAPSNVNLRMMHGINKISIIMFVIIVLVMVVRFFMR